MATATRLLTYDDLLALPDDDKRYEILDGRLIELTSPEVVHQRVLRRLLRWFDEFVTAHDHGEVFAAPLDVRLSPHNIVQPDLLHLSYARRGVLEYRLVDIDEQSVNVYGLVGDRFAPLPQDAGTARSAVRPGLTFNLAALFASVR